MLLKKGMTVQYADMLGAKYIKKLESKGEIVTIMDLFDTKRDNYSSNKIVGNAPMEHIHLNY